MAGNRNQGKVAERRVAVLPEQGRARMGTGMEGTERAAPAAGSPADTRAEGKRRPMVDSSVGSEGTMSVEAGLLIQTGPGCLAAMKDWNTEAGLQAGTEIVAQVGDTADQAQEGPQVPAPPKLLLRGEHYFHENWNYMSATALMASRNQN